MKLNIFNVNVLTNILPLSLFFHYANQENTSKLNVILKLNKINVLMTKHIPVSGHLKL